MFRASSNIPKRAPILKAFDLMESNIIRCRFMQNHMTSHIDVIEKHSEHRCSTGLDGSVSLTVSLDYFDRMGKRAW